jgi:hypothetical protein
MTIDEMNAQLTPSLVAKSDRSASFLRDFMIHRGSDEVEAVCAVLAQRGGIQAYLENGGDEEFLWCALGIAFVAAIDSARDHLLALQAEQEEPEQPGAGRPNGRRDANGHG